MNVQRSANNNIALDEYLEMLNRDSKIACRGHQTKESILKHSKEYPLLVEMTEDVKKKTAVKVYEKVFTICHHTQLMCNLS